MKMLGIALGLVLLAGTIPSALAQSSCPLAVATQGDWWGNKPAERFQRAMERVLLDRGVRVFELNATEVHAILAERDRVAIGSATGYLVAQRIGVCQILLISLTVTEERWEQRTTSVAVPLGDLLYRLGVGGEWGRILGQLAASGQQAQSGAAIKVEAQARLVLLPRELRFSGVEQGLAVIAESGWGYVQVGTYTQQYQHSRRADLENSLLEQMAHALVRRMGPRL